MSENTDKYEGWSIVELMGHRRLAGYVTEQEIAGAGMLRIDVPGEGDEVHASQFYSPSSLYCLTPVTEEVARGLAARTKPAPVQRWELPAAELRRDRIKDDDDPTPYPDDEDEDVAF